MTDSPLHQLAPMTWKRPDGYELSTDRTRIDITAVHRFLSEDAYWSNGLSLVRLKKALDGSLVIGAYDGGGSIAGFGRVVTDCAVFAYLRDVFVLPEHRGVGLAGWMAAQIREHPGLASITTWMLATKDAHGVYEKAGYKPVPHPEWYMSIPTTEP
jgi:GNAT superfamily N-acetyltransferase